MVRRWIAMKLGEYLIQARRDRGFSQRDLAARCGISPAEVSRVESGVRQKPAPAVLRAMADALLVSYPRLMQLAGYIEETRGEEDVIEQVFRDEETGEIVDVVRGVKEMVKTDAAWASVAYRVSRELNDDDRRLLTEMTLAWLNRRRNERGGDPS